MSTPKVNPHPPLTGAWFNHIKSGKLYQVVGEAFRYKDPKTREWIETPVVMYHSFELNENFVCSRENFMQRFRKQER